MKAGAYKKGDCYYFFSYSKTTAGLWIASGPFKKLESSATPTAKGEALIECLNGSRNGVAHPIVWNQPSAILEMAGVKSWRTFMKTAKLVTFVVDEDMLKAIPHDNLGAQEGYQQISKQEVQILFRSTPEKLSDALEVAMARCL